MRRSRAARTRSWLLRDRQMKDELPMRWIALVERARTGVERGGDEERARNVALRECDVEGQAHGDRSFTGLDRQRRPTFLRIIGEQAITVFRDDRQRVKLIRAWI